MLVGLLVNFMILVWFVCVDVLFVCCVVLVVFVCWFVVFLLVRGWDSVYLGFVLVCVGCCLVWIWLVCG